MGTSGLNEPVFYTEDGKQAFPMVELTEIAPLADTVEPVCPAWCETTFSFKLKTPKHWRCRSRKRFIKLMMGEGMTKREAEQYADRFGNGPLYQWAWEQYLFYWSEVERRENESRPD